MAKMIFIPEVATEIERTYTTNGNYNINVGNAISKLTIITKVGQPKLYTPIISLSGNTLYISDSDNGYFASSYDIYYGASSPHNVSRGSSTSTTTEVDLKTFITASGTYIITVVAKANNFVDSDESDSVSYTVASQGYKLAVMQFTNMSSTGAFYYSVNNGSTWTQITSATVLTQNASQVKFRITWGNESVGIGSMLSSATLSLNLEPTRNTTVESANYTLTQNVDDIVVEAN